MSAPASSTTSGQSMAPPTPPNSAQNDSTSNGATVTSVKSVVGFNHLTKTLFKGEGTDHILIDHSGSIDGPNALLERTAVAALIKGSNAEGKFVIPKPSGGTAILSAVSECLKDKVEDSTVYLFTDGEENCYKGPLVVGKEADGSPKVWNVDFTNGRSAKNAALLANWLESENIKVCVLGIGPAAQPMVQNMLNRKNVFCAHIDSGADTRAIVSVMHTLKGMSNGLCGSSVTRNGKQHALLVTLNEEVQESIKNLTPQEMDEFDDVIGNVIMADSHIVCTSDLKRAMNQVFSSYDEDISGHEKDIKAALLLAMESMCDGPIPAALVSSKHSAIIGVPQNWREFRRHCNRLFSRMASAEILERDTAVPEGGIVMVCNGFEHKFSAGCAVYSCQIPKSAVTALAEDQDFCTPRDDLPAPKKKRKSSSNSGGSPSKKAKHQDTPIPASQPLATLQEGSSSNVIRPSPSSP